MLEIWKTIPEAPRYQASNLGRVRSTTDVRGGGKIIKPEQNTRYPKVTLALGGSVNIKRSIHTLVLQAFVGPRPEGKVGRHEDDDPTNNKLSNLSYGTQKENLADRTRNGNTLRGESHCNARLTEEAVKEILSIPRYARGQVQAVADKYGMSRAAVMDVRMGRSWTHLNK